jgi:hypothetical protein
MRASGQEHCTCMLQDCSGEWQAKEMGSTTESSFTDSYGDGWNGATLQVLVNNVSVGTYSENSFG